MFQVTKYYLKKNFCLTKKMGKKIIFSPKYSVSINLLKIFMFLHPLFVFNTRVVNMQIFLSKFGKVHSMFS